MIQIKPLNPLFRIIDILLSPFMWLLGGMRNESLQETHPWHTQAIDGNLVPAKFILKVNLVDTKSKFDHSSPLGLYHMPLFGGLTKYFVVEAKGYTKYWHICWKVNGKNKHSYVWQVQRLPLWTPTLKLLAGKNGGVELTAINDQGEFIPIRVVGQGELGDGQFPGVRLL